MTGFVPAGATSPGRTAPQGAYRFKLVDCTKGATVRVSIRWPQPVTELLKYGMASRDAASPSFFAPDNLSIDGNVVSFDVTDGQRGDDDWTENGEIVDPVMALTAAAPVIPVPALNDGALWLVGAALAALGLPRVRRRLAPR